MSQKYDKYLENHRQAVKKAYQWIAAYIPEITDVEATRNIAFHDMSKNTPDEFKPYDDYFYGNGICLIEWANLIEEILPEQIIEITIEKNLEKGFDYRKITVTGLPK